LNQLINCDSRCSASIKSEAFESVVKKCKFIDNIVIKSNKKFSIPNAKQILQIIADNCLNLKTLKYDFNPISEKGLKEFGQKCGQRLRKIEFRDNYNYNTTEGDYSHNYFFSLCPNLLSISGTKLFDFIDNNVLLLPKITEIKYLIVCKEIKSMDVLVDNCRHSLKRLGIKFIDRKFDETERIALMKHISSFANLEKLYISNNSRTRHR
jgi:hypothetical protein